MPTLTLPASEHLERTILGCCLTDQVALTDAMASLESADFSLDSHQRIFRAMLSLNADGQHVDLSTLRERLLQRKELDAVGGFAYVLSLEDGIPRNFNVEAYCKTVKEKSLLRKVFSIAHDATLRAQDPSEDASTVISDLQAELAQLTEFRSSDLTSIPDLVKEAFPSVDTLYTPQGLTGLQTHYHDFDRMTNGLQESELIIIAARPSMGKTAWAINIAQNAAMDGKVVAVFSLEMSKAQLFRRMLASLARVSARSECIGSDGRRKITEALEQIMDSRIFIDDTAGISLAEMRAKARRLKHKHGLDLILVDYLQLMDGGKKNNRTEEVSGISRGLKGLAKEMKVPVIALSQLSRANEQRADKRPFLSDLRESGSIEQDADVVAFIHREEYYDRDNADVKGRAEVILAKQRNGPVGTIHLAWIDSMTRFENLSTRY